MPAVILRYAGTKYLAGFYFAESEDHLHDLIDEEHDLSDYEYAVIRRGFGIEFRRRGNKGRTVDYKIGKGYDALAAALADAHHVYLTEALMFALTSGESLKWRRLYEDRLYQD